MSAEPLPFRAAGEPPFMAELTAWQGRIRLTGNHRYQVLGDYRRTPDRIPGKWQYVSGTTGVIPKGQGSVEGLKKWAGNMVELEAVRRMNEQWDGLEHPANVLVGCGGAHRDALKRLSAEGNAMHSLFEREFRIMLGEKPEPLEATDHQLMVLSMFRRWCREHHVHPLAVEAKVYNPVTDNAGMLDILCLSDFSPVVPEVWDYKRNAIASAGDATIYPDRKLQNISYRMGLQAMLGLPAPFAGRLIYYPGEGADLPIIEKAVDGDPVRLAAAFTAALSLYRLMAEDAKESA